MNKKADEVQITDKSPGIGGSTSPGKPADIELGVGVGTITAANGIHISAADMSIPGHPAGPPIQVDFRKSADKPGLKWNSLADELYRVYEWADGSEVRLENPSKLNVSESGGHRVYTMDGISHYIPSGWKHLWWLVRPGCPHFAF